MKQIKPFENFRINEAEATRLPNGSMHKDPVTGKSQKVKWIESQTDIDMTLFLEADRKTIRNRSLYYYENIHNSYFPLLFSHEIYEKPPQDFSPI
jgi:hypothetical protein